jgi:hypothetical protein
MPMVRNPNGARERKPSSHIYGQKLKIRCWFRLVTKLHNARSIVADYRAGHDVFSRFTAGKDGTQWYYSGPLKLGGEAPVVKELSVSAAANELVQLELGAGRAIEPSCAA